MLEELLHRRTKTGTTPNVTKAPTKFAEVSNKNGGIQGSTKRTANESGRGFWAHIDRLPHRCDFGDRDTAVDCI